MRQPSPPRRARRLCFAAVLTASAAFGGLGALAGGAGCGPQQSDLWLCLNPVTGKEDSSVYDANHYVGGVFDPCHCYDPCGPSKSCPMVVDAGPPPPGCDAGTGTGGGSG